MSRNRWGLVLVGLLVLLTFAAGRTRSSLPAFAAGSPPVGGQLPNTAADLVLPGAGDRSGVPGAGARSDVPGAGARSDVPDSGPPRVGVASRPVSLRYTFDGGIHRPIMDASGRYQLRPFGQNGGSLRLVPQASGFALAYPNRCRLAREKQCPRAILQGVRDDSLNPGTRPLRYGASVRMTHADLADGANVLQKGYSVGGMGQFKLQVDHRLGHPSCVVAGGGSGIYRAEPWIDVADGKWHDLACVRRRTSLSMLVDGVSRASVGVPADLSIANPSPLRVGGKGPGDGNDQFAGEIDNVFLTIGGRA